MRYSLNKRELQNFKARIAERLVEEYINEISIPQLKKEGYDLVFFDRTFRDLLQIPLDFSRKMGLLDLQDADAGLEETYNELINSFPEYNSRPEYKSLEQWKNYVILEGARTYCKINEFFLSKGVFLGEEELYDRTYRLLALLEVATDGLIFKLNKTGETVSKNSKTLSRIFQLRKSWSVSRLRFIEKNCYVSEIRCIEKNDLPDNIPAVSGSIEIVEVKADKALLAPNQAKNYKDAIEKGYPLRYFHVFIISFENNHFEIKEKIINNLNDFEQLLTPKRLKQFLTKNN